MKYANGKKKVLSLHGVFGEQIEKLHSKPISSIAKIAESQVLQWPDKLTTDSKATQKIYKEKFNLDFEVLPSALDTQQFSKIGNIKKIPNQICYIGRDSYEKGIDILKKAESKINGNVVYCTNRSWVDAMSIMKSSSLVVVPSRMESLPTTVKEAFFLNIPVVATNVGGIPELITHDKTGILVPPDNPDKLADEINNLLFDKIKSEKLIENANIFLKNNMTWDVVLPKFINFYEKLLK
jgi:glycosyltransferase involved in cell wall biosynthesis